MNNRTMSKKERNDVIEKEVQELIEVGVPEWQARETAAVNLGLVSGDVIKLKAKHSRE